MNTHWLYPLWPQPPPLQHSHHTPSPPSGSTGPRGIPPPGSDVLDSEVHLKPSSTNQIQESMFVSLSFLIWERRLITALEQLWMAAMIEWVKHVNHLECWAHDKRLVKVSIISLLFTPSASIYSKELTASLARIAALLSHYLSSPVTWYVIKYSTD